jgi:hypothetical protein
MTDEEAFEVELIVGPNGKDPVDIYFEPTGMMHSVAADEHLHVKIYAPHPGVPELWHGPSDIVIWG